MEYSAVIHPPTTFCSFIQRGTASSTVTPQMTRVWPHSMSVEPLALGAMWFTNRMGRSASGERPSGRRRGAMVGLAGTAGAAVGVIGSGALLDFNRREQTFQVVQWSILFRRRVQHLAPI